MPAIRVWSGARNTEPQFRIAFYTLPFFSRCGEEARGSGEFIGINIPQSLNFGMLGFVELSPRTAYGREHARPSRIGLQAAGS
jgi:hypothetical protein